MFAKLSALALCLSFVSALTITAPATVEVGGSAELHLDIAPDDPTHVQLVLLDSNNDTWILETDVPVQETMYASIPYRISEGYYVIDAVDPSDSSHVYAESNTFYME